MKMFSWGADDLRPEPAYNTVARRIFPFPGVEEPPWGGAWVAIEPGETSTPHAHDEKEMMFVVEGTGLMRIGDERRRVARGDTIFITPGLEHDLTNDLDDRLLVLAIWWDTEEQPLVSMEGP